MQHIQAFKYVLMPTREQQRAMYRFAGSCRFVFNKALALQSARYERGEKKLGYAELCKMLTEWRNGVETTGLKDAPVHLLQQALKNLEWSYRNFFAKRADFLCFKKKGQHDSFRSFRYPDSKQIALDQANSRIFLPKFDWLRYRKIPSRFECVACRYATHVDVNAARNILVAGHAVMACEGDVSPYRHLGAGRAVPAKQEPAEVIPCNRAP